MTTRAQYIVMDRAHLLHECGRLEAKLAAATSYAEAFAAALMEGAPVDCESEEEIGMPAFRVCQTCGGHGEYGVSVEHYAGCIIPKVEAFLAGRPPSEGKPDYSTALEGVVRSLAEACPMTPEVDQTIRYAATLMHPKPLVVRGERVETMMQPPTARAICRDCDGCGWVEGGELKAIGSKCDACGGTGEAPNPVNEIGLLNPPCPNCDADLVTVGHAAGCPRLAVGKLSDAEKLRNLQRALDYEERLDAMVDRFLGWRLPADFGPDAGISFKPYRADMTPDSHLWPVGTNLLTAIQARAMLEYVTEGLHSQVRPQTDEAEVLRQALAFHCLQPDPMDSACKCCQRRWGRLEVAGYPASELTSRRPAQCNLTDGKLT